MENKMSLPPRDRRSALEKNIGNWVIINLIGNSAVADYMKGANGREAVLNPYKGTRYNEEHNCNLFELIEKDSYLELFPQGVFIEPTNIETINYRIEEQNEEILKELKNKENNPKE